MDFFGEKREGDYSGVNVSSIETSNTTVVPNTYMDINNQNIVPVVSTSFSVDTETFQNNLAPVAAAPTAINSVSGSPEVESLFPETASSSTQNSSMQAAEATSVQSGQQENSSITLNNGVALTNNDNGDTFGNITSIDDNLVTVRLSKNILELPNLVNMHVAFRYEDENIIGEVVKTDTDYIQISIIGEVKGERFVTGLNKKPNYNSRIRIVNTKEVVMMFGDQELNTTTQIRLGYSNVYNDYKINIDINTFFSNHFAIMGNTGSGKSCTLARLVQNIFHNSTYLPVNVNLFLFDAYGEYNTAFSSLSSIDPRLNYKAYTTNTIYPDTEILKIPLWLLGVDDIALLLSASEPAQLPIIEKALKLVPILRGSGEEVIKFQNDIIARALLDILKSGKDAPKVRDQITAVLTDFHTEYIKLDAAIHQTGYDRTIRQCIYVDNAGKLQEMELLVAYLSTFIIENFTLPNPKGDVPYTLADLESALDFALISEGILKSDKVFDYANILSVRLHSLAGSESAKFFEYEKLVTRNGYISDLLTTFDGKKAQIINFNINFVDDRMAKNITKIISKMLFEFAAESKERGTIPFHIIIEEAHRYVQNDIDAELLGYNIFERITKEGRKYGVILGLITQRPSELSETCISQCSNFIILRTQHPRDLTYIKQMVPNFSDELASMLRILQPGNAIAFGSAFRIAVALRLEKPDPEPYSRNSDIARIWYAQN